VDSFSAWRVQPSQTHFPNVIRILLRVVARNAAPWCKRCARSRASTRRALGWRVDASAENFLTHFGGGLTTDLFLAAAGFDPASLQAAVPPPCLRSVDPAPAAVREGADTVLTFPTWTPRRPATHLLPSFSPLTDSPLAFRFEISAHADGAWSAWAASATIGDAEFVSLPAATPPLKCDVDVFHAARAVHAVRMRVRLRPGASARWMAALSAADDVLVDLQLPHDARARLQLPALSQREADPGLGARICSPTSLAMVLGYWGRTIAPAPLAAEMYHPALDIYGVWPVAIRAAAARGVAGYLLRFPNWGAARWCLERGIPIVTSVRYAAGELTDAAIEATPGHLLVLTGVDGDAVLVNDPAAATAATVCRRYRADEFGRVWLARGGVGYVLFDPARVSARAR
jgi:Peptidase_C39 like family